MDKQFYVNTQVQVNRNCMKTLRKELPKKSERGRGSALETLVVYR